MIEIYFKTIRDDEFNIISDFRTGSWIHIDEANLEDLKKITELTGLEITDILDSLDKYENPRIEHKDKNIIIFVRHPSEIETGLHTNSLAIILTHSFLITISSSKSQLVNAILQYKTNLATTQKSKLLFNILLKVTQEFTSKIKKVRNDVIEQEKKIKNITNDAIIVLTKNEEVLNQYLSALVPMRNLLEAITSGRFVNLYEKDYDLLQDLLIAIKQSEDLCRVNVKSIRSLRDSYQIIFTNDVNKTMKILTAITIIFTIPTIISSIYGMNVKLPLEKSPFAFFILINIMILTSIIFFFIFIRKRWF